MEDENPFALMGKIVEAIEKIEKENPSAPGEKADPRVGALIEIGTKLQRTLDPLVRETFRDQPETLAEWDSIMHMCDDFAEPEYLGTPEAPVIRLEDEAVQ